MQILRAGMLVHARRHRWRVVDARAYDDCQLVTLSGLGPANAGRETRLLAPFDSVEPIDVSRRLRFVRATRWRRVCRDLLSRGFTEEHLCAAGCAGIDLLPHQLEPAIALIRGDGCRLLLADDVGLGKTIQAGLAIAELRARAAADRVLIVTPAGLREQWAEELSQRFDIRADVVDFRSVARRGSMLPYGINPWTTWPVVISSIDYIKRAEVLPAVAGCSWDVIVVDEAHGLASDSDRHEAVAALAARAVYVMLLTATPHSGDVRAFKSLCAIGGERERLLVFRRTRDVLHTGPPRRVHRLLVRPSDEERRMHDLLADFSRAVRAEHGDGSREMWLALAVLHKRAYSSARALQQTIVRRLTAIGPAPGMAAQLELPLDAMGESDAADESPRWQPAISLRDRAFEWRLLTALAAAAESAGARETKLSATSRLLDRIAEPVIVFTEYRDTLERLAEAIDRPAALLHGGLSRQDRSAALGAFTSGERRILLATDAAGEGLNLQRTCRIVINLELPWNPMRLEQRIGRVDRIGQRRTVHAFHLVSADTGEQRLLSALCDRVARAQVEIGAPNPLGGSLADLNENDSDQRFIRLAIDGVRIPPTPETGDQPYGWRGIEQLASCHAAATAEARRLEAERTAVRRAHRRMPGCDAGQATDQGPLAAVACNGTTRAHLGSRLLAIWEVAIEDGCGHRVFSEAVATAVALTRRPSDRIEKRWVETLLASAESDAVSLLDAAAAPRLASVMAVISSFIGARIAREHQIGATLAAAAFQPGLFDRRVHHAIAAARAAQQEIAEASARRLTNLEHRARLSVVRPTLRLVLVP
jgi:superfamily II DNA or RNA helicase